MGRVIIGSAAGALAMFLLGYLFFATPLYGLAASGLDNGQAAAVQQALAANLPATGSYHVPVPNSTPEQAIMYGQGPIATVHYNVAGFSFGNPETLIGGLVLAFVAALLMGAALAAIAGGVPDFGARARVVVLFALAASAFMNLGQPIMFHHGWGYFIYLFVTDAITLSAGGLVIARWFLGGIREARTADVPSDV